MLSLVLQLVARRHVLALLVSAAGHLAILLALLPPSSPPPERVELMAMPVLLIEERAVVPSATSPATPNPSRSAPSARPATIRPARTHSETSRLSSDDTEQPSAGSGLSDSELAGAATAGAGGAGGACDMARSLQSALRTDPLVQTAVAGLADRAVMVWNGDWVRKQGEDGKGLAAVREAMMWHVAFAPQACRSQTVHGLVLFSLNDAQGSARLAIGKGEWRWSDLLAAHAAASGG
ncbi:MAG: hypothetical protein ACHP84_06520 [Caulobacterales bacterium]